MSLDEYKDIFIKDTSHYKKRGIIRTYKKLISITKSSSLAVKIMVKHLNYDLIDVKYMFKKIEWQRTRYLKTKSLDRSIESNFIYQ